MKIAGIIAEFNPFHKGHEYLIKKTREETGADHVIALMSGNFVQRGEPAIFDMGVRTEMALKGGTDAVFELPPHISLSSAEGFALGSVYILDKLGADILYFGSECGDIRMLSYVADFLTTETEEFRKKLRLGLKSGMSFPAAREAALLGMLNETGSDLDTEKLHFLLQNPNNILGIEYLKALKRLGSSMTPGTVRRINSPYHENDNFNTYPVAQDPAAMSEENTIDNSEKWMYSAEAVRKKITAKKESGAVSRDALSPFLLYTLLSEDLKDRLIHAGVPEDLLNRIIKNRYFTGSFTEFCEILKKKNITYTAVSRCLLRLILKVRPFSVGALRSDPSGALRSDPSGALRSDLSGGLPSDPEGYVNGVCPDYIRLLGFRENAKKALRELKRRSELKIISNSSDIKKYKSIHPKQNLLSDSLRIDRHYELLRDGVSDPSLPLTPEPSPRTP